MARAVQHQLQEMPADTPYGERMADAVLESLRIHIMQLVPSVRDASALADVAGRLSDAIDDYEDA